MPRLAPRQVTADVRCWLERLEALFFFSSLRCGWVSRLSPERLRLAGCVPPYKQASCCSTVGFSHISLWRRLPRPSQKAHAGGGRVICEASKAVSSDFGVNPGEKDREHRARVDWGHFSAPNGLLAFFFFCPEGFSGGRAFRLRALGFTQKRHLQSRAVSSSVREDVDTCTSPPLPRPRPALHRLEMVAWGGKKRGTTVCDGKASSGLRHTLFLFLFFTSSPSVA